jgi:hypothetical protein
LILFLGKDSADVVYPSTMVLLPNIFDLVSRLLLDHGHLHDFSKFARARVSKRHGIKGYRADSHDF